VEIGDVVIVEKYMDEFPSINNDMRMFLGVPMTITKVSAEDHDHNGSYRIFQVKENHWGWRSTWASSDGTPYEDEEI
jgi:hypothetical protein